MKIEIIKKAGIEIVRILTPENFKSILHKNIKNKNKNKKINVSIINLDIFSYKDNYN